MTTYAEMKTQMEEQIKGVNRYNPNQIQDLEKTVKLMVEEVQYDKDVLLTLLKLYQLNPATYNEAVVKQVLLKTMMVFPRNDYALAKYLIDTPRANSPELRRVMDIGALLEANNFSVFWKLINGDYQPSEAANEKFKNPAEVSKTVKTFPGFEEAVRKYACQVINITFQTVDKVQLGRLLGNISDNKVQEYANVFGWTPKEDGFFVQNHEATIKSQNIEEKLSINDFKELMTAAIRKTRV
ncbi:hypothetical protein L596_027707 [Steinernema carpocapsae]|uniref:Eukaryotic translation initiation factor 3 subunit K n=1 Tax=Steinernema carpocapsae TaxID=34508 RepID=A0A4U5LWA3_STECR|nr:hypothetical protein L596_027707 [Steinernema carpocapsae]